MDVIFEASNGRQFSVEIGFFDKVLEIKEKIQKYEGHPVSAQTLVFKGQVLADDGNTELYEILQGSKIKLSIDGEPAKTPDVAVAAAPAPTKVRLSINIPVSKRQISLESDVLDTVARVKERIFELEGIPANRFVLFAGNAELQEHQTLADYGVSDHSEINVMIKPLPPPTSGGGGGGSGSGGGGQKKLKILVLPKCGTKKIQVEVNASENVSELRKELQRLHGQMQFHLPPEGYFFIYKQNVMDDDRSFRWHDVRQGDTVEIFNGSVTGGT